MSGIGEGQRGRSLGRSAPLLGVLLILLAGWFGWSAVQQWRQEANGQALEEARQAREESQKDLRSCQLASTGRVAELANTLSLVRQEKEQETKNEGTFGSWAWFRDGYLEKLVLIISGAGAMKVLDLLIIHWKP